MLNKKSNNTKLIMETWRRFISEGTQIENQDLVFASHNAWLEGYNATVGTTPRPKSFVKVGSGNYVKVSEISSLKTSGNKSVEDLLSQGKLYFSDDRKDRNPELLTPENEKQNQEMFLFCDIVQPPEDVIVDCLLQYNGPQGKEYLKNIKAIKSAAESGDELVLGELMHNIWKEVNKGWKDYWDEGQAGNYKDLDAYNKMQDLLVAKAVCQKSGCKMSEKILELIEDYKKQAK
jgi:hypothetical protein